MAVVPMMGRLVRYHWWRAAEGQPGISLGRHQMVPAVLVSLLLARKTVNVVQAPFIPALEGPRTTEL